MSSTMTTCADCSTTTNLWICLICGNVGCGRYGRAHAHAHYQLTTHVYALELETQRVWDYAGDAYVHRLIQNRADGKLVELPSASISSTTMGGERGLGPGPADAMAAEKVEAIGIEYSYLLTSQLDSQRAYYEEQTAELRDKLSEAQVQLERAAREAERHRAELEAAEARIRAETEARAAQVHKEREKVEKRAERATELARKFEKELREEKMVSEGLLKNLAVYREKHEGVEEERKKLMDKMADLEDQLRDVMFFLETKDKIDKGEGVGAELAGGSLEVSIPAPAPTSSNGKKKRKK
jgi:BRCA1-associated protein